MTRLPRVLAGVALAVAVSLLAGACNAQPDAASVNGTSVNESALDAELALLSANRAYIQAVDRASARSGQQVAGAGHGTYNSLWTAHVLAGIITADAVHQYLAARGQLPGRTGLDVAAAVEAADYGPYWQGFPASYRATLVQRTADLARLGPPALPVAELRAAYHQLSGYLFREVCVRAPSFVTRQAAQAYASRVAAGGGSALGARRGSAVTCYDSTQLYDQRAAFAAAARSLPVGTRGAVVPTAGGYEVVVVTRRASIPFDGTLRRTLGVVAATNGGSFPRVQSVLSKAKVTVDPQYGTWHGSPSRGYQVLVPRAPA